MPSRTEIAERFFTCLQSGNVDDFAEFLDAGVVYEFPEGLGTEPRMEGKEHVGKFLSVVPRIYRPMDFHDVQTWDAITVVVAEFRVIGRAVKTGRAYRNRGAIVFEFNGENKVTAIREYLNTLNVVAALKATS